MSADNVIQFVPRLVHPNRFWTMPPAHTHVMTNPDGSWSYMGPHYEQPQFDTAPSKYVADSGDCA